MKRSRSFGIHLSKQAISIPLLCLMFWLSHYASRNGLFLAWGFAGGLVSFIYGLSLSIPVAEAGVQVYQQWAVTRANARRHSK